MINFDAVTRGPAPTRGASSESFSHPIYGDNRLLLVFVTRDDDTATANDDVSGVTYNSVSMTLLTKINTSTTEPGVMYVYGLLAPATGSNTVQVSLTGSTGSRCYVVAISYTGVSQSGLPDSVNTKALQVASTSFSISTTTVADNSWVAMMVAQAGGSGDYSAGSGTTFRDFCYTDNNERMAVLDSGGAITPAGSTTLNANNAVSRQMAGLIVSFAPATVSAFIPKILNYN